MEHPSGGVLLVRVAYLVGEQELGAGLEGLEGQHPLG